MYFVQKSSFPGKLRIFSLVKINDKFTTLTELIVIDVIKH